MPYKIYTYADPYMLDQADFWPEIESLPHFCVARTLVNGLKDVLGNKIQGLICPLEDFINHDDVYGSWTNNINRRVQQYGLLTSLFRKMRDDGEIDTAFFDAIQHNQNHFLDALRLFIELGVSHEAINAHVGNYEQQVFIRMLCRLRHDPVFLFPPTPTRLGLEETIRKLAVKERNECHTKSDYPRCERAIGVTNRQSLQAVVIHGVHQFSPAQLRLAMELDRLGLDVIFLINYQKKFPRLYGTWEAIYSCFDVPFHHDRNVPEYRTSTMQNPSNALACALGELFENPDALSSPKLKDWHQLYKNIGLIEFLNVSEYAHYVSNHVEVAKKRYSDSRSVRERGDNVWNHSAVLRHLTEKVYTANRDIHTLLQVYYPEYSSDRHFLSYPIGQFFSAIYKLWDNEKKMLIFDLSALKECLSSAVLSAAPGEVLLRTFYNLEVLFENVHDYNEFIKIVKEDYLPKYNQVVQAKSTDSTHMLRQLSVYNKYKIRIEDILAFVRAIEELNEIAHQLFAQEQSPGDYVNFGKHFKCLEDFLRQREFPLANVHERALIDALRLRLDTIHPERSNFSGTFRDLREGLYFYLKQKESKEPSANWIVKNFEQIDGDILLSKNQADAGEDVFYHFACLSDRDMNQAVNDLLPWPLTEEFFDRICDPIDLQFQVYHTSLVERSNFLRYALFYGLYFNHCGVHLSYVSQYENEQTEPYVFLRILGLKRTTALSAFETNEPPFSISIAKEQVQNIKYDRFQAMDMLLCPYRYLLDYVLEDSPVIQGTFLYQKYYENLLIEGVWMRLAGKPLDFVRQHLQDYLIQESDRLAPFFFFWKKTDILDLRRRAFNYFWHEVLANCRGVALQDYPETHMKIRRLFGAAKFYTESNAETARNPFKEFEALTRNENGRKCYSLHMLPKPEESPLKKALSEKLVSDLKKYLDSSTSADNLAIPEVWCTYCVHRGTCIAPYLFEV